jgi:hypothetical protein|tara:strand:- start:139 stop:432 length:294 start_codon:yes stop_codon:yes gene_type:complete
MNIRDFTISVLDGVEIRGNLNPVNPHVYVIKDGGKVRSLRGRDEVARFCQTSFLSILELMSDVQDDCEAIKTPDTSDSSCAKVIPINSGDRFGNIEF